MKRMVFGVGLIAALLLAPLVAQDVQVELQRAVQKEVATGDLKGAIADYQAIVRRAGDNKAVAAQALIRMADAHRKLGDAEAKRIYERVLREFPDQKEAVAHARAALGSEGPTRIPGSGRSARSVWSGPNVDSMGSPSADGRLFSFTDWDTGDLAIRDMVAGTNRRLTDKGPWEKSSDFAEFSIVSPDGRHVAYGWFAHNPSPTGPQTGLSSGTYQLRLISVEQRGAKPRVLDTGHWIQPGGWTVDGRHIAYVRHPHETRDEIMLVSLPDGKPRVLTGGSALERPTISPDGKYVAYAGPAAPNQRERDIFIVPVDGGAPVAIQHPAADWQPFWTMDGARLLFASNRSGRRALWSLPMRGGKPAGPAELVDQDVSTVMGVTRDRAIYDFRGGNRVNIYLASLDGSVSEPQLLSELYVNQSSSPAWSPDGESLAHYATVNPGARIAGKAIAIRSARGGSIRTIVPQLRIATGIPTGLRWFGDGRSLLAVSREENMFGFHRVDATTGVAERLMETPASNQGANGPDLSADGKALFYIRENPGQGPASPTRRTLIRRDLATGTEVELKKGWFSAIALSRDGQHLAYLGNDEGGSVPKQVIAVLPAGGGAHRVLFEGEWPQTNRSNIIAWDPEGRLVYFVRQEKGVATLWRVPAAGGSAENTGVSFKGNMASPHIHPDGKRVAFTGNERTPPELWLLENYLPPPGTAKK